MQIIIFHYHLNPGGVTKIIQSQVKSLLQYNPKLQIKILCGYCPDPEKYTNPKVKLVVHPELNYLLNIPNKEDSIIQLNNIVHILKANFKQEEVGHFHNLNLGKNPLITIAVSQLIKEGYKVLNHCHDFAEDREDNMKFMGQVIQGLFNMGLQDVMYPVNSNILYGTLNFFDYQRLEVINIPAEKRLILANPVDIACPNISGEEKAAARLKVFSGLKINDHKKIITYPVRVIRRKNIGEFILLSVLFKEIAEFLVTLPPKNPIELEAYEKWVAFCQEHNIILHFDAGKNIDFNTIMLASDFCCTTSIREGFGMAYLEPWTYNTPVIGRDIEYITCDLRENGIEFSRLYKQFLVPQKAENIDFKNLSMPDQQKAIVQALNNEVYQKQIKELNPFLENFVEYFGAEIVLRNKESIKKNFSLEAYGRKLYGAYTRLTEKH